MLSRWAAIPVAAAVVLISAGPFTPQPAESDAVDRSFAATMIERHQSAIYLAQIAQDRAQSVLVRNLAGAVERTRNAEMSVLERKDGTLGAQRESEAPVATDDRDPDLEALRDTDRFDRLYLDVMLAHTRRSIVMARRELAGGVDRELRDVAANMMESQERELEVMTRARRDL